MQMTLTVAVLVVIALLQRAVSSSELHFSQSEYSVTVNETYPPEYPRPAAGFLTLLCTPSHSHITYSINSSEQSLPFAINSTTGALTATADLDYDLHSEGVNLYSFNVSCSDTVDTATALVQVYINPINEFLPDIDPSVVLNVTETTPSGTLLLSSLPGGQQRLVVEDMDSGPHGQLNYTLLTPLDEHFTFDPLHANLTLARAVDFESESSLSDSVYHEMPVKIRVCDTTTPIRACPVIHIPVYIIASDDNQPMFLNDSYTIAINETTVVGSSLLELVCFDADVHIGQVRAITLLDPPPAVMETFSLRALGQGSSELTLARELDYDQLQQTYHFQVVCRDLLHSTTTDVSVAVLPVNDEVPTFTSTQYQFSVSQTTPAGTVIGQVRAVDMDIDSGHPISYAIHHQTHNTFHIDPTTGEMRVNSSLRNHTASTALLLTVSATDGDWETHVNVTVNILHGNFHSPQFTQPNLTIVTVHDLIGVGVNITALTCIDWDLGAAGSVSYSTAHDTWAIGPVTGELTAMRSVQLPSNASATQEYQLTVQCRDYGLPYLADEIVVIVQVYRSDVNPPQFVGVARIEVSEGVRIGHEIVNITASDNDTSTLNFTIINQSVPGTFSLDMTASKSSVLRVGVTLDHEETPEHQVTVEVEEVRLVPGEPQRDVIQLTIHVLDVNDHTPQFTEPYPESVSLPDTTPLDQAVHSVECRDEDSGTNGQIVYEILPQHTLFAVDPEGNVLVNMPLTLPDFTFSDTHNVSIQCRDKATPPLTSNKTLTLTINKLDTQPPVVNISNTSISLAEDLPSGAHVLTLEVYDIDSPNVSVVISSQTLPGTFAVTPPSTPSNHPHYPRLILNGTVDREGISTHHIELLASSHPSTEPPQNVSFSLAVTVLDVNDNVPNCTAVRVTITAGLYSHRALLSLSCSDLDEGLSQQLVYRLDDVNPSTPEGQFSINQTSGGLSLDGGIAEGRYDITAIVSDQGIPPLQTHANIEVEVVKKRETSQILSLGIVVILMVVVMLVLVGVSSGCGLCCCYWSKVRADKKRKQYVVSNSIQPMADMSAPATTTSTIYQSGGVTIISHPTFSDATSVISHALVPLAEETDGLTENSTEDCEEVTITFNPSTETSESPESPGEHLSVLLEDQWPLPHTASLSSFKEDLVQRLEASVTTFKGSDWHPSPPSDL